MAEKQGDSPMLPLHKRIDYQIHGVNLDGSSDLIGGFTAKHHPGDYSEFRLFQVLKNVPLDDMFVDAGYLERTRLDED